MIGRQERTLSLISSQQLAVGQMPPQQGGQAPPPPAQGYIDTIRRHEVDTLMSEQNTVVNAVREIR